MELGLKIWEITVMLDLCASDELIWENKIFDFICRRD